MLCDLLERENNIILISFYDCFIFLCFIKYPHDVKKSECLKREPPAPGNTLRCFHVTHVLCKYV